ncbi:MAG: BatA domain-containing protein [Pirellulaceae bacterium]|nr:BatA domain-containing protein [Pirellulaceae bacterium]
MSGWPIGGQRLSLGWFASYHVVDMQFLYSPLTWGFLLVGVPILVHLINLLRYRRQRWAAMEFLLESYRRNRRWVLLKQWLLLMSRMLAMMLLVMLLAKWVSSAQWLSWLGGKTTHHYVLLDDSYSMGSLQLQGETAYQRALKALAGLTRDIANQPGEHQITLLRWSRAALALGQMPATEARPQNDSNQIAGDQSVAPSGNAARSLETIVAQPPTEVSAVIGQMNLAADLSAQTVPGDPSRLLDRLTATEPTALQLAPESAIELIEPAITAQPDELSIVYFLTDLRRSQFADAQSLRRRLLPLSQRGVAIHVVDCADSMGENLSLVSLVPEQEVWAIGVPLMAQVVVRNQTSQPAKNVVVKIRQVSYRHGDVAPSADQEYSGVTLELPPVVIESIGPGQSVTRQFQVVFPTAGQHIIEATLPDDALAADNRRHCVLDIHQSQRVLLIDGDALRSNAFYFQSVIQPGERLQTGISFDQFDASFLRDAAAERLLEYDVIALLDIPRLDPQAISKLEEYRDAGGGVLIMCGPNTNLQFANEQLYRGGEGLLPVQLQSIEEVPEVVSSRGPQVVATEHPILSPLSKLSSNPFFALRIRRYLRTLPATLQSPGLEVVAFGPDLGPLVIDSTRGAGHVVTILTGMSSEWSTWAQDPTFVVMALRSLGYLGSFRRPPTEAPVGTELKMVVVDSTILPQGDILLPGSSGRRIRLQRPIEWNAEQTVAQLTLPIDLQVSDRNLLDAALRPGVIESWMTASDGSLRLHNQVRNVAPEEGDLERIGHQELARQFAGVNLKIRDSGALSSGLNSRETSQSSLLLFLLVALLLAEQMLAYSASYHARPVRSAKLQMLPNQGVGQ